MKKEKKHYLIWCVLLAVSCKAKYPPPSVTLCTALSKVGVKFCAANEIPPLKNGIEMQIKPGDIVLDGADFKSIYMWGTNLREKLISCEQK